jgi:hypothetical protein
MKNSEMNEKLYGNYSEPRVFLKCSMIGQLRINKTQINLEK